MRVHCVLSGARWEAAQWAAGYRYERKGWSLVGGVVG